MELIDRLKQNYHAYGYRGLLLSAKSRVLPPQSLTRVKPPAFSETVLLRTRSSDIGTYHQIFIDSEYDVEIALTPEVIIDAGANVGYTALYFSNKYPTAKILAIEPETSNFELLKQNVVSHSNIVPIKAAIWRENTEIQISDPGVGNWGFRSRPLQDTQHGTDTYVETVQGITLNKLLADYAIETVDILKVDIEGAERDVFEDASEWIDKVGVLMIELHDRITTGCTRAVINSTRAFEYQQHRGENFFLSRKKYVPDTQNAHYSWVRRVGIN